MKRNHLKLVLGMMVTVLFILLVGSGPARTAPIQEVEDSGTISKQKEVHPDERGQSERCGVFSPHFALLHRSWLLDGCR